MSYRPLGQFPQYFLDNGNVNAGGFIHTYETDLTTDKLTYSDPGLTVENPILIPLDASGRPSVDVWGDGAYGMEILDSGSVVYLTANNIQPDTGSTQTIPALETGEFLTNDGSNLLWQVISQVPDPSGFADYILSTDGANFLWIPAPEVEQPNIEVTTNSVRLVSGGDDDWLIQKGSAVALASGTNQTTLPVTFLVPFKSGTVPNVQILPAPGTQPFGPVVPYMPVPTATGFTASFDVAEGSTSGANITNDVNFQWIAQGVADAL
jgi:hypothetical protein